MRWAAPRRGGKPGSWTQALLFHDLLDDEGSMLGYVVEDTRPGHGFTARTNNAFRDLMFPTRSTLKEAKDMLIAHFVVQKLEGT